MIQITTRLALAQLSRRRSRYDETGKVTIKLDGVPGVIRFDEAEVGPTVAKLERMIAEADAAAQAAADTVLNTESWCESMNGFVKFGEDIDAAIAAGARLAHGLERYTDAERAAHVMNARRAAEQLRQQRAKWDVQRAMLRGLKKIRDERRAASARIHRARIVARIGAAPARLPRGRTRRTRTVRCAAKPPSSSSSDPYSETEPRVTRPRSLSSSSRAAAGSSSTTGSLLGTELLLSFARQHASGWGAS